MEYSPQGDIMVNKVVILMNMPVMTMPVNGRTNTPATISKTLTNPLLVIIEVRITLLYSS